MSPARRRSWTTLFLRRSDLPYWRHWPDAATTVHPLSYAWTYEALALAAYEGGEFQDSTRYLTAANACRRLAE